MSRLREIAVNASLVGGAMLTVLVLAEGTLRAVGFRPDRHRTRIRLTNADDLAVRKSALVLDCYPSDPGHAFDVDLRQDEERRRYEAAGVHGLDRVQEFPFAIEFRYNSRGYRGPELPPRRPGVRRVAVVGDSFTEGQGVREGDTYVRRLEDLLNASEPGGWEVLNFGYRAHDFPELQGQLDDALAAQPDAVVFGMVLNDGERVPSFDKQWPALNDWIMVRRPPVESSWLSPRVFSFVRDRFETYRIARDTTRWYRDMYGPPNADGWQRTKDDLRKMRASARAQDAKLLVALWPLFVDLDRDYPFADVHDKIGRVCEKSGIPFEDLLPAFRGRATATLWAHPSDWHPNATAHRLAAEALLPRVRALVADAQH